MSILFFSGLYTSLIWGIAQLSPNQGKGFIIEGERHQYYQNIGQAFYSDRYFWSRPSAASYNAAGSCGSNKGPSNEEYLALVQQRIDTFMVHNPGIPKSAIPVELLTASGSGLDPHISPQAAWIQVKRIAKSRHIPEEKINQLVKKSIDHHLFGPQTVNVLQLNLKLENL